jgi:rubrerythrin
MLYTRNTYHYNSKLLKVYANHIPMVEVSVMATKDELEANFKGETSEVALYLAMSKQAEREGHHTAAMYFRQVAMDEAWHGAEVAELLGRESSRCEGSRSGRQHRCSSVL